MSEINDQNGKSKNNKEATTKKFKIYPDSMVENKSVSKCHQDSATQTGDELFGEVFDGKLGKKLK